MSDQNTNRPRQAITAGLAEFDERYIVKFKCLK